MRLVGGAYATDCMYVNKTWKKSSNYNRMISSSEFGGFGLTNNFLFGQLKSKVAELFISYISFFGIIHQPKILESRIPYHKPFLYRWVIVREKLANDLIKLRSNIPVKFFATWIWNDSLFKIEWSFYFDLPKNDFEAIWKTKLRPSSYVRRNALFWAIKRFNSL